MPPLSLRGISIVLSVLLLAASVGLEVRRRSLSTRERARFGLLKDDVEMFGDAFQTSLRLPEACRTMFAEVIPRPGERVPVSLDYRYDATIETPLAGGAEAWAGTQLGKLDLTVAAHPDRRTRVDGRDLAHYRARVDAEFRVGDRFKGGVPISHEVLLWTNDAGEIVSCHGPNSVGALCDMAGGWYDVDARSDRRCRHSLHAAIVTKDRDLARGSCRISGVKERATSCPGGARHARVFQDKMGYGTVRSVLCMACDGDD